MHKKIIDLLKHEENVIVKDKNNNYQIISNTKDKDGDYGRSGWLNTIEEAKESIGNYRGYPLKKLEELAKNWEIIDTFPNETELYNEGQKVRVLPQAKEILEKWVYWGFKMEKNLGQVGKIICVETGDYKVKFDDGDYFYFTHDCLSAFIPEAVKETAEEEAMKLLKSKGFKIIKE